MIMILFAITIASYLYASYNTFHFAKGVITQKQLKCVSIIAWIGVVTHIILLSQQIISPSSFNFGASNAFSLTVITMLIVILPNLQRHSDLALFLLALGMVSLIITFSYDSQLNLTSIRPILGLHIIASIAAYAILMLAALQAIIIFLKHYSLKAQPRFIFKKLPPLMNMEKWLFQLLLIGCILLTSSLITAIPFFDLWFTRPFIHRTLMSIVSWGLFGSLLYLHHYHGLRGKRAAKYTVIAFAILLLGVTGTRLIQEIIFNRT